MSEDQGNTASGQSEGHPLSAAPLNIRNVNTAEALARFAGDEARYRHWLLEFIDHGPGAAAQIRQAITKGSHEAAIKLVHALKGRTGMLGMTELQIISRTLEMALRSNEPAALWLDELEISVNEMGKAITEALGNTPRQSH